MNSGPFFFAWTQAQTAITNIVANRVYPDSAPEGAAFPMVIYSEESNTPINDLQGPSGERFIRLAVELWDKDSNGYSQLRTLAAAIEGDTGAVKLNGYRGSSYGSVFVQSCQLVDRLDDFIPPADGSEVGYNKINLTFEVYLNGL